MNRPVVGYYAHHHGRGHLTRAAAILEQLDADATVLTSGEYSGPGSLLQLPLDDDAVGSATAGGMLHWAPLRSSGLRERMSQIASWIGRARPDVLVVDVSVEVSLLARLCGVPTVVIAMPGERSDLPHQLAYRAASRILATLPQRFDSAVWLREHADRTAYVGGISRFDGRAPTRRTTMERTVVLLGGRGGEPVSRSMLSAAEHATPGWRWVPVGDGGTPWIADPWPIMCQADVIVSAAGQSAVADLAVIGAPAIVICQDRPFGEQLATGRALQRGGMATVLDRWPDSADWPELLQGAPRGRWGAWRAEGAAARAARIIEEVAR